MDRVLKCKLKWKEFVFIRRMCRLLLVEVKGGEGRLLKESNLISLSSLTNWYQLMSFVNTPACLYIL